MLYEVITYIIKSFRLFYGFGWIPIVFVFLFFRKEMVTKQAMFLFIIGLISLLTTIFIGGDHFHLGRFVLPVLPFLFVFLPPAFEHMSKTKFKYLNLKAEYREFLISLIVAALLITKPVYKETANGFYNLFDRKKDILEVYDVSCEEDIIDWQLV